MDGALSSFLLLLLSFSAPGSPRQQNYWERRRTVGGGRESGSTRLFEEMLLSKLEMKSRPPRGYKRQVPQYMISLYSLLAYVLKGDEEPGRTPTVRGYNPNHEAHRNGAWYVNFDISSIPTQEIVTHAELVLYRRPPQNNLTMPKEVEISVQLASQNGFHREIHQSVPGEGYHPYDVITLTKPITDAFVQRYILLEFTISINITNCSQEGLSCIYHTCSPIFSPLLVVYENIYANVLQHIALSGRHKRSTDNSSGSLQGVASEEAITAQPTHSTSTHCQKHSWVVRFLELGYDDWIYEPQSYMANFCSGPCPQLLESFPSTNHAYVRSKYFLNVPLEHQIPGIPRPCCVPLNASSINLLYRNHQNETVYRQMDRMVVDSCACM